ncbi:hypothetical protein E8E11_007624 [Didymella keratinophila]|nr:hypothetical protein E8E11_007624 [Didymella keratinophila]
MAAPPPSVSIPEGMTHGLFICAGLEITRDVWMFADFQATSKIFMATGGMTGTYLNLYDYKTYLNNLPKEKPQRIAWGYQGFQNAVNVAKNSEGASTINTVDNSEPIITFTPDDHVFFEQIPPEDFPGAADRIIKEMKVIAMKARHPNKVNIFIFGHGGTAKGGFLQLGGPGDKGSRLYYDDINKVIREDFDAGVQVNVIAAACFSGLLLDKIEAVDQRRRTVQTSASSLAKSWSYREPSTSGQWRGPPFINAFAASFDKGLRAAQATEPARTVAEHFRFVDTLGCHSDPSSLNIRTRNGDERPEIVFTPPKPGPQYNPKGEAAAAAADPNANDNYMRGIEYELRRLRDPKTASSQNDYGFFTCINYLKTLRDSGELLKQWGTFLKGMRWRLRVQEYFFVVFHSLLRDEMIDEEALKTPMHIDEDNLDMDHLMDLLSCFEVGLVCSSSNAFEGLNGVLGHDDFAMPLRWLSILILRSHPETELASIVQYLYNSRKLGKLREDVLKDVEHVSVKRIPDLCKASSKKDRKPCELAFWLPTTPDLKLWAEETLMRYEHYQDMYNDMYGEGTWGGADTLKKMLRLYESTTLEDILGPRLRQHEKYMDNLSPLSPLASISSSSGAATVFSAGTTASTAITEDSMLEEPLAEMSLGMED